MKKFIKWCLILAGLLLAVGIGLNAAGAAMGGWVESGSYFAQRWETVAERWDGISGRWYVGGLLGTPQTKDSGAINDSITAIDVDVDCGDVMLRRGESFSVSMNWNLRGFTMDYEIEDGVLKVESDSRSGFLNGVSGMKNEVTVTVPEGAALDKVKLSTNLGDVEVDADFTADEVELETDLGDVTCGKGVDAGALNAQTDLGDVNVSLPGSKDSYRWELETDLGELRVDDERLSGDVTGAKYRSGKGSNWVTARSSLGDVSVNFGG